MAYSRALAAIDVGLEWLDVAIRLDMKFPKKLRLAGNGGQYLLSGQDCRGRRDKRTLSTPGNVAWDILWWLQNTKGDILACSGAPMLV